MALEQEIKLRFDTPEAARQAVTTAGGRLVVSRRLLDDQLYDSPDGFLQRGGRALRLRRDGAHALLTFKGPAQPGPVKSREELETSLGDVEIGHAVLTGLGFRPWFRSQKYREEFALGATRVAVDDTPIGAFVEIEGAPADIEESANRLGRSSADYILDSYASIHRAWSREHGFPEDGPMLFDAGRSGRIT